MAPAHRWRLVDGLFGARRPAIEGGCTIAGAALVCFFVTGKWIFLATLGVSIVVLAARLLHGEYYSRASGSNVMRRRSPEYWAKQYCVSMIATAAMWVALNAAAFPLKEPGIPFFILAVQSGWLGAAAPRNAALPAGALGLTAVVLVPQILLSLMMHNPFIQIMAPFGLLQLAATINMIRATGTQITATILSEQELEAANARLTELSATDGLTGIANRRSFDATFQIEWARAARDGSDLGLLMIDVDCFKAYNDHYGHPAGDDCLRMVADLTAATLRRPPDTAARFGGEEFIALLPGTDGAAAMDVADRVRLAIVEAGMAHAGSVFGRVTISIGSASLAPHPGQDRQGLIDLADRALYEAKQSGRNTVRGAGRGLRIGAWRSPVGSDGAY